MIVLTCILCNSEHYIYTCICIFLPCYVLFNPDRGPLGAVLAGQWADQRGRRGALMITTWLFIFGGLVQALAPSLNIVIVGRAIIGVASGASTVLVPIYLGELAPPSLRGVMGTMTQFALVIGILVADLVGFVLANPTGWRYMFFLTSAMAFFQLL